MLPTGTGKRRINLAVRVEGKAEEAPGEPVGQVGLVELAELVGQEALAELAGPVGQEVLVELAGPVGQEALAGLAVPAVRVAPAGLALVQVVAQEPVPVAAELELAPAVVEPELVRVAVPLRTKSATAAHHHGQVPVLVVEDLAAVAETTPAPAATEVVAAWAAAVTAVVAVAVAAVADVVVAVAAVAAAAAAVVVVEDAEDKRACDRWRKDYENKTKHRDFFEDDHIRRSNADNSLPRGRLGRSAGEKRSGREARQRARNSPTRAKAIRHTETGGRRPHSGSNESRCLRREGDSGPGRRGSYQF